MKEIKPLLLFIAATLITTFLVPLGIIYNFGKALYHCYKLRPLFAIWYVIRYWLMILYQIWNAIKYLILRVAVVEDLIWNATAGEMIEDCVTAKEETLYGNGNITVSAATGNLEENGELNRTGILFSKFLSKTLGEKHCLDAWQKEKQYPINE